MYIPDNFELYELITPELYNSLSNESTGWRMWDDRVLRTAQLIRNRYNCSFVINDWFWSGNFKYSGWRPMDCPEGAKFSQHKYFHALDMKPDMNVVTPEEIRQDILKDPWQDDFKYITSIELDTPTWLHISTENWNKNKNGLLTFKP